MLNLIWVFCLGGAFGFVLKSLINTYRSKDYSGTIHVNRDDATEKTVYSLELDDYPEVLQFKKVVIFKVDSPDRE
jgi:hypothetical protein